MTRTLHLLALALFLSGALMVAMVRGDAVLMMAHMAGAKASGICLLCDLGEACWVCQRSGAFTYWPVHWLLDGISSLFFLGPDAGPLMRETPWGFAPTGLNRRAAVDLLALYLHRVVAVTPVFLVAATLFRNGILRLVYVVIILSALGGWPAAAVNAVFTLGSLVANWPPAYYNFAHPLMYYDWSAMGFMHLLVLYSLRVSVIRWWHALLLAALGQMVFDNLGLACGLFLTALCLQGGISRQWRRGALVLAAAGLGTVMVVMVQSKLGTMNMSGPGLQAANAAGTDIIARIKGYFSYYWEIQGKYNFLWFNVTLANLASLLILPALAGLVLGIAALRIDGADARRCAEAVPSVAAAALSISVTFAIGLVVSAFGSDMGRQVMPLILLMVLLSAGLTARLGGHRFK